MGNNNQISSNNNQSTYQPPSSPSIIQIYHYNQLYGRYKIQNNQIIKQFQISSQQYQQFLSFIETYQQIITPSIMKIIKIQQLNHRQLSKDNYYAIYLPYYKDSLSAEIYQRKLQPYKQGEIVGMLLDICQALEQFVKYKFNFGYLIPDKIAISYDKQSNKKRYIIGLDMLLNHQNFINKQNKYNHQSLNKYISPQQLQISNPSNNQNVYLKDGVQSNIYSLGIIILKMMFRDDFHRNNIQKILFSLRQTYSLKLLQILRSMLIQNPQYRINISSLTAKIKDLEQEVDYHQKIVENKYFIPGYNYLEDFYVKDEQISLQSKIKWAEKIQLK